MYAKILMVQDSKATDSAASNTKTPRTAALRLEAIRGLNGTNGIMRTWPSSFRLGARCCCNAGGCVQIASDKIS